MISEPATTRPLGLFIKGFAGTVLGTVVWQLCVVVANELVASSHWLAMHTRYRAELAVGGWLIGLLLNGGAICLAYRRAQTRTQAGIRAGFWLLLFVGILLAWLATITHDIVIGLRD